MKETLTKESSVHAKVNVQLPSSRVNEHLNAFFAEVAKHAKVQGFRKGKVPPHVVKKLYQEEAHSQVGEKLISEALLEVIRKHDLKLILPPQLLAVDSPKENQDFSFEASLDLKPEVPEIDVTAIEVEDVETKIITDDDVHQHLDQLREQFTHYHDLKQDRPAIQSDSVTVSYTGSVDGEKIDAASSENQELVLGKGQTLKEFEEAIVGMNPGEMKNLEVEFSQDHQIEAVKGRKIQFQLMLKKIREQHIPDLDDGLAQKMDPAVKTLDELREKTKAKLQKQEDFQKQKTLRDRVGDALIKMTSIEVSPRQKKLTAENMLRDQIQQLSRWGMPEEEIRKRQNELIEESSKEAEKQIRLAYVLEKIARQESLQVSQEDIDARMHKTAELTGASLDQIKQYYQTAEENDEPGQSSRMDRLKLDLMDEKSLDYALSKAKLIKKG